MSTVHLLFLAILVNNASVGLSFKIPAENRAELPPRVRPDILKNHRERAYSTDRGNPIKSRSRGGRHRKHKDKPYNMKRNDARYSDPKYWNEISERFQQRRESRRQSVSFGQKNVFWKTIAIALAIISSPVLVCLFFMAMCMLPSLTFDILLGCGPWAIAGFALYKSVELLVEGRHAPLFKTNENTSDMDNMRYEADETDSEEIDESMSESGHMAFQP